MCCVLFVLGLCSVFWGFWPASPPFVASCCVCRVNNAALCLRSLRSRGRPPPRDPHIVRGFPRDAGQSLCGHTPLWRHALGAVVRMCVCERLLPTQQQAPSPEELTAPSTPCNTTLGFPHFRHTYKRQALRTPHWRGERTPENQTWRPAQPNFCFAP